MMKGLLVIAIFLFFVPTAFSQIAYTGALGLRIGSSFGISGKYFLTEDIALEGYFTSRRKGYEFTVLGLKHRNIAWNRDFNWFYGGGAHIGFSEYQEFDNSQNRTQATVGIDGMIGAEYNFQPIPINIALDYKPEVNFSGASGLCLLCGALSVRYVFK